MSKKRITFSEDVEERKPSSSRGRWYNYLKPYYDYLRKENCNGFNNYVFGGLRKGQMICLSKPPNIQQLKLYLSETLEMLLNQNRPLSKKNYDELRKYVSIIGARDDAIKRLFDKIKTDESVDEIYDGERINLLAFSNQMLPVWAKYLNPYCEIIKACSGRYSMYNFNTSRIVCSDVGPTTIELMEYLLMILSGISKILPRARIAEDLKIYTVHLKFISDCKNVFLAAMPEIARVKYNEMFVDLYNDINIEIDQSLLDTRQDVNRDQQEIWTKLRKPNRMTKEDRSIVINGLNRLNYMDQHGIENEDERQKIMRDVNTIFEKHHVSNKSMRDAVIDNDPFLSDTEKDKMKQFAFRVKKQRKSPKRKSPKRKSPKRKSPKRKSPKRNSPKRK